MAAGKQKPLKSKMMYRRQAEAARNTARTAAAVGRAGQVSRSSIQVGDDAALLDDVLAGAVGTGYEVEVIVGDVDHLDDTAADEQTIDGSDIDVDDLIDIADTDPDLGEDYDEEAAAEEALHATRMRLAEAQEELNDADAELDSRLTSARADLDAAETRIEETEQRVTDSETQIGGMLTDLDTALQGAAQAQLDANLAKGLLSVKPAAPVAADGQGKPIGAMWVHHAASGIQTLYEWTALGWVPRPLSETIIPKVAIGTGTYGELDGVRLKANSVLAKSIAVGDFTNYASIDPVRGVDVTIPPEYSTKNDGVYTTRGTGAQNYIMVKDRTDALPFKGGEQLRVTFRAKATVSSSVAAVVWAYPAKTGGSAAGNVSAASSPITIGTTESEFSTVIAIPAGFGGSATLQSWIAGLRPGSGVDMANVSVRDVRMVRMASGEFIVDGGVEARHVATGTLQALAATITEAWIKSAHIVSLDVSKLIASSAVLSEAVIEKLYTDVVKTKLLTVTEKLITKDIIALGAIDGMTITAPLIRTAPSGQRLQFDVNGLRAFDSAGVERMKIMSATGGIELLMPGSAQPAVRIGSDTDTQSSFINVGNGLDKGPNEVDRSIVRMVSSRGPSWREASLVMEAGGVGTAGRSFEVLVSPSGSSVTFPTNASIYYPGDTNWINLGVTGWTHQVTPQVRVRAGRVQFRGIVSNGSFTGGFTACGSLPSSIPPPPYHYRTEQVNVNTAVPAVFRVNTAGGMEMWRDAASGAFLDLSRMSYEID